MVDKSYRIEPPVQDRRAALGQLLALPAVAAGIGGSSGCASSADTTPAPGAAPAAGKATFIFSVSHERAAASKEVGYLVNLWVIANGPSVGDAVFTSFDSFSPADKSALGDALGQVYVKEVAPGRYAFVEWRLADDTNVLMPRKWYPRNAPPALQFDARADEVIYLGNLHGLIPWRPLLPGLVPTPAGVTVEVRDRAAVDLPVALARYPPLRDRVTMALLPRGTWGSS
jgi:hypothetical protein